METEDLTPAPIPAEVAPTETETTPEVVTTPDTEAPAPEESTSDEVPTADESPVIDPTDIVARVAPAPALQMNGSLPLASAIVING